ncbi:hypothetical protein RHSIM_RhsimUnG0223900 [Rhododendron simsii]|uniref:Uncharacterized protein n=1 Tax=Rhododendron simsii TaxID=118357 RepID=A0A834L3X4_RHOSS|nr:hypothetical protein RHSIM_RhsimUnG0223900 [Rhododendron simsii]
MMSSDNNGDGDKDEGDEIRDRDHSILDYCFSDLPKLKPAGASDQVYKLTLGLLAAAAFDSILCLAYYLFSLVWLSALACGDLIDLHPSIIDILYHVISLFIFFC